MRKGKIKVAIIEDQLEIGQGLLYLINASDEFSCTHYLSAEEAIASFTTDTPNIVLMDIVLGGMSGIECTRYLKEHYPDMLIMMCTVYEDEEKIFNALSAGASGYILKRTKPGSFLEAIRDLYNGGAPISAPIAKKVVTFLQPRLPASRADEEPVSLSERELEVLDLLAGGYRNKEVADKLNISMSTVKSHIYNIYQKLHVTSKIEAFNKLGRLSKS